jgi:uncharacterized membrane protein
VPARHDLCDDARRERRPGWPPPAPPHTDHRKRSTMGKGRLEAFSDGVIAIIITIMVLELKVPHGHDLQALLPLCATLASYVMSFVIVGIYWNNHHHLLHASRQVNGRVLWANLHLLFWLSLVPFVTSWMGENEFAGATVGAYGGVILMSAIAYTVLAQELIRLHGRESLLGRAFGSDRKGRLSLAIYATGIGLSFVNHWAALGCYALVSLIWLIPDTRIERLIEHGD